MYLAGCNLASLDEITRGNSLSEQETRILAGRRLRRPLAPQPQLQTAVARSGSEPDGRLV